MSKGSNGRTRILILGAGGRDFHNFNTLYRHRPEVEVVGFTASQIPFQQGRLYPAALAGSLYPHGIPIFDGTRVGDLVRRLAVDLAVFSYSDVSHERLMAVASRILAAGADFKLIAPERTMLDTELPLVSVCAVRTGCGKSPVTRYLLRMLLKEGRRPVVVRHPMAYGRLEGRAVQAYYDREDLDRQGCTLEEREEYEPLVQLGVPLFAGIDYQQVLKHAEQAGDILIWDGGNNDTPFFRSDLEIVLVDPLRPGDELSYYPGYVNLLRAGLVIVGKLDGVPRDNLRKVYGNLRRVAPQCRVVQGDLVVSADDSGAVAGRRVVIVEDGPSMTHGGLAFGAGYVAAQRFGAAAIVDPRPYATGSLDQVYTDFPHIGPVLPAMGYSDHQLQELEQSLAAVPCDLVLSATPVDLRRMLSLSVPMVQVVYEFQALRPEVLLTALQRVTGSFRRKTEG